MPGGMIGSEMVVNVGELGMDGVEGRVFGLSWLSNASCGMRREVVSILWTVQLMHLWGGEAEGSVGCLRC